MPGVDSDPTYNWRLRATAATARLDYSPDLVNEAAAILLVVLGREWLASVAEAPDHSSVFQLGRHPLGHALTVGGETQLIEILEVVEYLKTASNLSGFNAMVSGLKSQYRQTLLPLALAHRLRLIGGAALVLEPTASGGRLADIALVWSGARHLVECYRPTITGRPEDHMGRLLTGVLQEFSIHEHPVAVAIQLRRPLDHRVRKAVVKAVAKAKRDLSGRGFQEALLVGDANALISIAPTEIAPASQDSKLMLHSDFPRLPKEASQFARSAIGTQEALNVVNPRLENPTHSCVAIWTDEATTEYRSSPDPEAAFKRAVRKVKRKVAQTRSEEGARRVVVVDTWVTEHLHRLALDPDGYIMGQVLCQHTGAMSVLFVRRTWDRKVRRYRYMYRLFAGPEDTSAPSLVRALISWEDENVVPAGIGGRPRSLAECSCRSRSRR